MRLNTLPRTATRARRLAGAAVLVAALAGLAACTDTGTPGASGTPTAVATPGATSSGPTVTASGACGYLTGDDVNTSLKEKVLSTTAGSTAAAADGSQVEQCLLTTDGPALLGGAAQSVLGFVGSLVGGTPNINLTTGGVAVLVTRTATPITAAATGAPVPSGGSAAPGIGKAAYAVPSPTGGGIAVSQVSDKITVIIVDLEAKQVTADQLTALLKAAVARV